MITIIQILLMMIGVIIGGIFWVKGRQSCNLAFLMTALFLLIFVFGAGLMWFLTTRGSAY